MGTPTRRVPFKTTSCSIYTADRRTELPEHAMCHPDLYAYIKVFGNERQRIDLVGLKSKTRRMHLLPLYRQVKSNRSSSTSNSAPPQFRPITKRNSFTSLQNMIRVLNEGKQKQIQRDELSNQEQNWYNQLTENITVDDVQHLIDALENGTESPSEVYKARQDMTQAQRNHFDHTFVELLRYRRFQKEHTMKLFVSIGKFRRNAQIRQQFSEQEKKWFNDSFNNKD